MGYVEPKYQVIPLPLAGSRYVTASGSDESNESFLASQQESGSDERSPRPGTKPWTSRGAGTAKNRVNILSNLVKSIRDSFAGYKLLVG